MTETRIHSFESRGTSILDTLIQWIRFRKIFPYIPTNSIVCDLGCGLHGTFLRAIQKRIQKGIGVDLEVDATRNDAAIQLVTANFSDPLPLPDASVDVVTSLAVLEHLTLPKLHAQEAFRLLKQGGVFVMTTPTPRGKWLLEFLAFRLHLISSDEIADHKHYYTHEEIRTLLTNAGFDPHQLHYSTFVLGMNSLTVARKQIVSTA